MNRIIIDINFHIFIEFIILLRKKGIRINMKLMILTLNLESYIKIRRYSI